MPAVVEANAVAAAAWAATVDGMASMGILAVTDARHIAVYCLTWARLIAAEREIEANGGSCTIERETKDGTMLVTLPAANMAHKLRATLLRYAQEMGLTPCARARIASAAVRRAAEIKKARFFDGGGGARRF